MRCGEQEEVTGYRLRPLPKVLNVIPAEAGIQTFQGFLDPRLRRGDVIGLLCKGLRLPAEIADRDTPEQWVFMIPSGNRIVVTRPW